MTAERRFCTGTIEGPLVGARGLPLWRRQCRNRAISGYAHCHLHLSEPEKTRRAGEHLDRALRRGERLGPES